MKPLQRPKLVPKGGFTPTERLKLTARFPLQAAPSGKPGATPNPQQFASSPGKAFNEVSYGPVGGVFEQGQSAAPPFRIVLQSPIYPVLQQASVAEAYTLRLRRPFDGDLEDSVYEGYGVSLVTLVQRFGLYEVAYDDNANESYGFELSSVLQSFGPLSVASVETTNELYGFSLSSAVASSNFISLSPQDSVMEAYGVSLTTSIS